MNFIQRTVARLWRGSPKWAAVLLTACLAGDATVISSIQISGRPALPQFPTFGTVARMATVLPMAIATSAKQVAKVARWPRWSCAGHGVPLQIQFTSQALSPADLTFQNPSAQPGESAALDRGAAAAVGLAGRPAGPGTRAAAAILNEKALPGRPFPGLPAEPVVVPEKSRLAIREIVEHVLVALGAGLNQPPHLIGQAVERLDIEVHPSNAQSYFEESVIHLCIAGAINSWEAGWRLLQSVVSECAHHYIDVKVRPRLPRGADTYPGVEEAYEAAGLMLLAHKIPFAQGSKVLEETLQMGLLGGFFSQALSALYRTPESLVDDQSPKIYEDILDRAAYAITRAEPDISRSDLYERLTLIFRDFFAILPEAPQIQRRGGFHLMGYSMARDLGLQLAAGGGDRLGAVLGKALGEPMLFLSSKAFLGGLAPWVINPPALSAANQEALQESMAWLRRRLETLRTNPIRLPAVPAAPAGLLKPWDELEDIIRETVNRVVKRYIPWSSIPFPIGAPAPAPRVAAAAAMTLQASPATPPVQKRSSEGAA